MKQLLAIITTLALVGCETLADKATETDLQPPIFPDYTDVTVPLNIAPTNFMIEGAEAIEATFGFKEETLTTRGSAETDIETEKWRALLHRAAGDTLKVKVYATIKGKTLGYKTFNIYVSTDSIDNYLSYRHIEPGYEVWNSITIEERDITTWQTTTLADNKLCETSCMNCHTYGKDGRSFFHLRGGKGGTILNDNGRLRKIDTRTDSLFASATYGTLHPSGRYGIYSTNVIIPALHSTTTNRMEVYDMKSDLVLIDFEERTTERIAIATGDTHLETFPTFSADGKRIIYCRAENKPLPDSLNNLRYDIVSMNFDTKTGLIGTELDTLWKSAAHGASAHFPRCSPDGKWILITTTSYGTFPLWHRDADLQLINTTTGECKSLDKANSPYPDTYHSWSGNGRWITFASKRMDGMYGVPHFSHIDDEGNATKPFALPQHHASTYKNTLKSFNIPELSARKANFDAMTIEHIYHKTKAEHFTQK
jgi:hypothetical protein